MTTLVERLLLLDCADGEEHLLMDEAAAEIERLTAELATCREGAEPLYDALRLMYDNLLEYNKINHLGGENNHDMRQAREALAKFDGARSGT